MISNQVFKDNIPVILGYMNDTENILRIRRVSKHWKSIIEKIDKIAFTRFNIDAIGRLLHLFPKVTKINGSLIYKPTGTVYPPVKRWKLERIKEASITFYCNIPHAEEFFIRSFSKDIDCLDIRILSIDMFNLFIERNLEQLRINLIDYHYDFDMTFHEFVEYHEKGSDEYGKEFSDQMTEINFRVERWRMPDKPILDDKLVVTSLYICKLPTKVNLTFDCVRGHEIIYLLNKHLGVEMTTELYSFPIIIHGHNHCIACGKGNCRTLRSFGAVVKGFFDDDRLHKSKHLEVKTIILGPGCSYEADIFSSVKILHL